MKSINSSEFEAYWKGARVAEAGSPVDTAVRTIIEDVRARGDAAVKVYAERFDRSSPEALEVPIAVAEDALWNLRASEGDLVDALEYAADNIRRFAEHQRAQFADFDVELSPGLITGQRVIPVSRAAIYVPAGRFPLLSSVLMGAIPALVAGTEEVMVASPPREDGLPDRRILAAAALSGVSRVFALGGAQAIAALALGTESVPRVDVIVGPGNKYVAAAKRILFGEVGIDFVAGPTDVLIVSDGEGEYAADLAAADLLAQAEHDADARARILLPSLAFAEKVDAALKRRLSGLPTAETARASLEAGGLMVVYSTLEEAVRIANALAPEHLELHLSDAEAWVHRFRNYGSLFIGTGAAEVLGDYSAGINHTLPTSGSSRFTGGLSVRHFLKAVTTLRCSSGQAYGRARAAAERIAEAEGLAGHRESAAARRPGSWI